MPHFEQPTISEQRYNEINAIFSHDDEAYEFFRSENQPVFNKVNVWPGDYVRQRMIEDADRLVGKLDGSIPERERISGVHEAELEVAPDVVIALDKSGRPLKDVAEVFWDKFAQEGATMPEFEFLNIDRIDWLKRMGYTEREADESTSKTIDMSKVTHEEITRIRTFFTEGELSEDNWQEEVWQLPTRLDDKEVLILDEVKNSGATLQIAAKLIQKAIPRARISCDYFWTDGTYKVVGGEMQNGTAPAWYRRDTPWGRGKGDVSLSYQQHVYENNPTQENFRNLKASFVVSAPHHDAKTKEILRDELYESMKRDLGRLALELCLPHPDRDKGWDERMEVLSEETGVSDDELMAFRRMRVEKMIQAAHRAAY